MRACAAWLVLTATAAGLTTRVPPARAQTADPPGSNETVLVTATRLPTPIEDVAAGVSVIGAAEMRARGATTLADALSAVPGVQLAPYGQGNASLFMRGANSNQVQVLIDGIPVNDASGPGGAYNFGLETLAGVVRIEVVRGPMSAVYGPGAIGGVVNIITERGAGAPRGSLILAGGWPNALLGRGALAGSAGAFDYSLAAETRSDRGADATPRREQAYSNERDGIRTQLGSLDLGYTPVAGTRLFAGLRGRTSVYGYDDVGYPAFDDPDETARDNDLIGRAGVTSVLWNGAVRTGLSASYDQQYRRYVNLLDAADPNAAAENSRYLGRRTDIQSNTTLRLPDAAWTRDGALTAGYEHAIEAAHERLRSSGAGYGYDATVDATDQRDAFYAGLQTTVARRLVLTGNVRQEMVSGVGAAFTWRAGGSFALPALASHLKASYGTAFLAPSLFDRYGVDSFGYVGNPALRPERSAGYEIGWSSDIGRFAGIEATWFHTRVRDLIQTVFAPVYTSINIARAELQGVETALHLHPARWLDADLVYTYTDARDAGAGTLLLRRPYDTGAATLTLRPAAGLTVVPQLTFAGGDRDALVDRAGYPAGNGRNPGGAIANLSIDWQLRPGLAVFAWGRDLNATRYEAASGFALPGPSFLAGIRLQD